jgi:hypothetical protein
VALLLIACSRGSALAVLLHVPDDYPTIAQAAAVAGSGDSIVVAPVQTYENEVIALRSGVTLYGTWNEQEDHWPIVDESTIQTLGGPDSTRIETLHIVNEPFRVVVDALSARTVVDRCELSPVGPFGRAGIRVWSGASIRRCSFIAAQGPDATGISVREGTLRVSNCLFEQGLVAISVENRGASSPIDLHVRNNTFFLPLYLSVNPGSIVDITNNIFHNISISHCEGSPPGSGIRYNDFYDNAESCAGYGEGNIDEFPIYCDHPNIWWLDALSPCLGAGENGVNIGAFGVGCGVTAISDAAESPAADIRLEVSPNPVRSRTEFSIIGSVKPTALEIYDSAGRVVDIIQPGRAPYVWEPSSSVRPGVYFVRLRANEGSATSKFVVLPR